MDMFDVFPNMTEKEAKTFVRRAIHKLYKQAKDLKVIPQVLRKEIEFNNEGNICRDVDKAGGRVQKSKIIFRKA